MKLRMNCSYAAELIMERVSYAPEYVHIFVHTLNVPIKQHLGRGGGWNGVSHHFAHAHGVGAHHFAHVHGVGAHHFDHAQGVGWLSLSWTKAMISQSLHNHFLCEIFCCKRQILFWRAVIFWPWLVWGHMKRFVSMWLPLSCPCQAACTSNT